VLQTQESQFYIEFIETLEGISAGVAMSIAYLLTIKKIKK
jgi:hypothetical protein